jgi:hypothetical protein
VVLSEVNSTPVKTYRVTLKISDANGNPVVIGAKGTGHAFTGGDNLSIYDGPQNAVLVVPSGEFAAIEISDGGEG